MPDFDRDALTAAHARSRKLAEDWRSGPAVAMLAARFAGLGEGDVGEIAHRAHGLLEEEEWAQALLAPLIAALRDDPWVEPPLRIHRDTLKTGAVLFESPVITITASIVRAEALAALPPPASVVAPGRLSIVRYVRSGGARLHVWRAPPADASFSAADAAPASPLGELPFGDGVVLRLDGRTRGWWIAGARSDVVTLNATLRVGAAPLMREYALPSGEFVRCATLDEGAARAQMLLTLLRLSGRADAGDCFESASYDPAAFLRWSAMREWLALDARAALPRLREMAAGDVSAEVREAAALTQAIVEARIGGQRCPA